MAGDKRLIRVVVDHAQRRPKKPRVGVVCRGWDFLEGDLTGMFVNPVWGVLQSRPNSEEEEYSTLNTGRWKKIGLSDVTVDDGNGHADRLVETGVNHAADGLLYSGENTLGVGVVTTASYAANTGINIAQYVFDNATDRGGVLLEFGWNSTADGLTGESVRVYLDGGIEIWRDGKMVVRSSFGNGGYQFGTVRGGSYVKASNEFVSIRAEIRTPYLILTSSLGGVFVYSCPWAVDQYAIDGTVETAAEPVVRATNLWWSVPEGGISIIWSPVVYVPSGSAVSALFALSEPPDGGGAFSARAVPHDTNVTVSLVAPNGTGAFDDTTNRCRVKLVAATAPVWIDATSTRYEPTSEMTADDETDITEWVRSFDAALEDGPEGFTVTLELSTEAPADLLDEIENRPFRVDLIPHPDDDDPGTETILLDGIGGPPEWVDGNEEGERFVRFTIYDRLSLLKDQQATETVIFDEARLCRPTADGESAVAVCLRQGGFENSEMELADIDFTIDHWPPQKADDFAFAVRSGAKWWDTLQALFDLAPSLIWGIKPTATGPKFFVIDPDAASTVQATLYRTPEAAAVDPDYDEDGQYGGFPLLYGDHKRRKLPIEGNLVRVEGLDPSTGKPITVYRSDDDSRDPNGTRDGRWLGNTRTVAFSSETIQTKTAADKVADSLYSAVRQRQYVEPWRSFMLFDSAGVPLWRGDKVKLKEALPNGDDSEIRITSMIPDIIDEHGGGLMDESGALAPISVRLASYTGGAILNLGGSGEHALVARHKKRIENGSAWGQRSTRRHNVSSTVVTIT